jgi:hypothetical protein
MSGRAQHLYERLKSEADLASYLIRQPEDVNVDAKEWHAKDKKTEKECLDSIVDAACGFANASGGVIAIGISAKRDRVNGEDLISDLLSFEKPEAVAAKVLDAIVQNIEPGIEGIVQTIIPSVADPSKGYVVFYVPESVGIHRTRTGKRDFVQRIGSSTLKMEYYQIRDRFGRRPHAELAVEIASDELMPIPGDRLHFQRLIVLAVKNTGRGIAQWPCIFVQSCSGVILQSNELGDQTHWAQIRAKDGSFSLRGTAENVVYPSEIFAVATLAQSGSTEPKELKPSNAFAKYETARVPFKWIFPAVTIPLSIACDGMGMKSMPLDVKKRVSETYGQHGPAVISSIPTPR